MAKRWMAGKAIANIGALKMAAWSVQSLRKRCSSRTRLSFGGAARLGRYFELKVDYRISLCGNSGINYRSEEIPNTSFAMGGYQADIDGAKQIHRTKL